MTDEETAAMQAERLQISIAQGEIEHAERVIATARPRLAFARERLRLLKAVESEAASSKSRVYFIQSEHGGPIKIGTTENVAQRLRNLQTGSPTRLVVLGVLAGGQSVEQILHLDLAAHRLEGEWFADHPLVRSIVDKVIAASKAVS